MSEPVSLANRQDVRRACAGAHLFEAARCRLEQVRSNLVSGVVEVEDPLCFDTTHLEAHSHCANVVPIDVLWLSEKVGTSCQAPLSFSMR